jgi:hypothetical protein
VLCQSIHLRGDILVIVVFGGYGGWFDPPYLVCQNPAPIITLWLWEVMGNPGGVRDQLVKL